MGEAPILAGMVRYLRAVFGRRESRESRSWPLAREAAHEGRLRQGSASVAEQAPQSTPVDETDLLRRLREAGL